MTHPLIDIQSIPQLPKQYLAQHGRIFATFGENSQDSGNISYGVEIGDERFFVKTAGIPDDPKPFLSFEERVKLFDTAVHIPKTCSHPALVNLHNVIQSPYGPMLIYEWVSGELVRNVIPKVSALPVVEIIAMLGVVYDLHVDLIAAGWIALDFYDGCLLYDFDTKVMRVMDLDFYQKWPFTNEMGRLFGSSRYMSPEEFELGAMIDQRSNVFTMGRTAVNLLSDGTLNREPFRGSSALLEVVQKACQPKPEDRFQSMREFVISWNEAVKIDN